jgi:hypothetical protein
VKNQDRLETLVSISTDGNVLEWSFKKGIVVSQLMQLKRAGVVSRLSGCLPVCMTVDTYLYIYISIYLYIATR